MRVAIDLTALNANPSGIDRYLLGLVRSLAHLEKHADFFLFINVEDRARFSEKNRLPNHCRVWPICFRPRFVRLFFQQLLLPILLYLLRIDVLHSPTFIMPLWRSRARHILTIHDMSSFLLPQTHPAIRRGPVYERVVSASIRRAEMITVPSESVKADILRIVTGARPERIRAIACGIEEAFHPRDAAEVQPVLQQLGISTPYIFFLGTLEPRKNLPLLIDAFAELVRQGRTERLVLGGAQGWLPNELLSRLAPGVRDRIHLTGYIAETELPFVYAGATLFVYPSLLEGFGFPPLEAMASGVPVIAANNSSLHENLAGAAMLVSSDNKEEMVGAMHWLLSDERARAQARETGLRLVEAFRWERFAEQTFACYKEVSARALDGGAKINPRQ
ncbi:MAG: glycosyltransferase family 4 protein [Verrucomicrobiota bacterium]|nr:glycosyltransferase family 4 protein [Verrucomicrobiota bacterium]